MKNLVVLFILFFSLLHPLLGTMIGAEVNLHKPKFDRILAQSHVTTYSVTQDNEGFLWFGAQNGLSRYDGYAFQTFQHHPGDTTSLSSDNVSQILSNQDGSIWVATWGGGLNRFDPNTKQAIYYMHDPDDPHSISHNRTQSIHIDREGKLWIGTAGGGLNRFDQENERFIRYAHDENDPNSISSNRIWDIAEDNQGALWIGTDRGLNRFDPESGQFAHYFHDPDDPHSLSHNVVRALHIDAKDQVWVGAQNGMSLFDPENEQFDKILFQENIEADPRCFIVNTLYEDHLGMLWVGTQGGLVYGLNFEEGDFRRFTYDPYDDFSLSNNDVRSIFEDRSHNLWIATRRGGLNKLDLKPNKFVHYKHDPQNPNSLSNDIVWSICEDAEGDIYVGTDYGLNRLTGRVQERKEASYPHLSSGQGRFVIYRKNPEQSGGIPWNRVTALYLDRDKRLWVGTDGGGLNLFDPENETFQAYLHDPENPKSIADNDIFRLYEDRQGRFWVGTDGGGLDRFDRESGEFFHFPYDPNRPESLSDNTVWSIFQDNEGQIWVGTGNGLNRYLSEKEGFVRYQHNLHDSDTISNSDVRAIFQDSSERIWIGTHGGGLNQFYSESDSFVYYSKDHGLPNHVIYGILEDDSLNLWLSTNKGLSKFNPDSVSFQNYDISDGLQGNAFNRGAFFKSSCGEMFFGGVGGFNRFYPDQIQENPFIPPVTITSATVLNQQIPINMSSETEPTIRFSYENRIFFFEFAALDFTQPNRNQYSYMLQNFSDEWINSGYRRRATYTNIPHGEYLFRVRGSNNDGVWNEEGSAIRVIIDPPFWKTRWFYLLEIILLGLVFVGIYHYLTMSIERKLEVKREQSDLDYAREMQLSILPDHDFDLPQAEIIGRMQAADAVGGDYYDLLELSDNRYCVVIGDVTGHATASGFVIGVVKMALITSIKSFGSHISVINLVKNLNTAIKKSVTQRYTGMGFGIALLDLNAMLIRLTCTGMPFPYCFNKESGKLIPIEMYGPPIGLVDEIDPKSAEIKLAPGDVVILTTDGFAESLNSQKEKWGFEAMEKALTEICTTTSQADQIAQRLFESCNQFTGGYHNNDDLTIVLARIK
ncbi:MAG: hypothetical protein B6244_11710 [Candidatus Cloacimonetes bacterium 4572_55]|nr:MAG: hypothetical protein B6244_11710 [Candidatus Cloacimonetes bacterium 4572_55]